jgi:hypothetical protein
VDEYPKVRHLQAVHIVPQGLRITWACQQIRAFPGKTQIGTTDRGIALKTARWTEAEVIAASQKLAFDFEMQWEKHMAVIGRQMPEADAREMMRKSGIQT